MAGERGRMLRLAWYAKRDGVSHSFENVDARMTDRELCDKRDKSLRDHWEELLKLSPGEFI